MRPPVARLLAALALAALTGAAPPAGAQDLPVVGRVTGLRSVDLAAPRNGQILRLDAEEGDRVATGLPLMTLDCATEAARHASAKAASRALELAFQSQRQLSEFSSATDLDVEVAQAEWRRSLAEAEVVARVLDKCVLAAPFAGLVTQRYVEAFEHVQEGDRILRLVDDAQMFLDFRAPVAWLRGSALGDRVQVVFADLDRSLPARIDRITPEVDAIDQTVRMRVRLDLTDGPVPLGTAGQVMRMVAP